MLKGEGNIEVMDQEWVQLILEAKQLGIAKEEVREFFINKKVKEESKV